MERALLIIWGIWLLLIFIAAFRVFAYLIARRSQDKRWRGVKEDPDSQKKAVVIVPVKGFDLQSTPPFFDTLLSQNYSAYRVIVAFESWDEPVAEWLRDELEVSEDAPVWNHPSEDSSLRQVILACAGPAEEEGQKVCNQRAAFEFLEEEDEIIAFADADISLDEDWLSSLTAPINIESHQLSTTYRWLIPKRPNFPSQLASVINGSITTQGGWEFSNVLWGGSMAIHRDVFQELDVPELVKGALNDDLRISKAARKGGNRIAFVRSLVLPTMIDFDGKAFFEFAKRQYTQVKFFSPILYFSTNLLLGLYALGFLSIIAALVYGIFYAWVPLAAAYVIDQFRGLARQQVYLSLFPQNGIRKKLSATCWLEQMLTPFWMLLHWLIVVSTWTQNRIQWGGIRYQILSNSKTRILDRETTHEPLPVGVPGLSMIAALHDLPRATPTTPIRPVETATEAAPVTEPIAPMAAEEVSATVPKETSEPLETVPAVAAISATPSEPAPKLSHPGVSIHVTSLRQTAISFKRERREASKPSSSILLRNGKLLRGMEAHTRVLPSTRYPVPVLSPPVPPSEDKVSTHVFPKVSRGLTAAASHVAGKKRIGSALAGLSHDGSERPSPAIHGMSRLALTLSKSADIPRVHFPTRPALARSSRPTGTVVSRQDSTSQKSETSTAPKGPPSSPLPAMTSLALGKGAAAHRPVRRSLGHGENGAPVRPARSGRANLASSKRRGLGRSRPVSRGASGRSV